MSPPHHISCALPAAALLIAAVPTLAGTLLVANKTDATVDLIDAASGRTRATLRTGAGPHEVAVSPDGRRAAIANYGDRGAPGSTLTVIDVERAEILRTIELGRHSRPHGLAWYAADRLAVTTEGSAHLLVVDPSTGAIVHAVETAQRVSHMVAVAPGGKRAFVANIGSGTVSAIDLEAGRKLHDVATGAGAEGLAITPDGAQVWVGNREADTLTVIDAQSLEPLDQLPCPGFPIRVAVTPDGARVLVSCARSGEVALFDVEQRRELRRARLAATAQEGVESRLFGDRFGRSPVPVGLLVSPDGRQAWVAATQADVVALVDTRTLELAGWVRAGREPDGMAFSSVPVAPPPTSR